jgi:hypothetical protein
MDTPAIENALFWLLKNKPLFVPHHWPITALSENIHSVVRERSPKNWTSCISKKMAKLPNWDSKNKIKKKH